MKLCKDCMHWNDGLRCNRPFGRPSVIDGKRYRMNSKCKDERAFPVWLTGCGKGARYFKGRES